MFSIRRFIYIAICKWGIGVIIFSLFAMASVNMVDVLRTRHWTRVPAVIGSVTALKPDGSVVEPDELWDGTGKLEVQYRYEVNGTDYEGHRVGVETFKDSTRRVVRWRELFQSSPRGEAWINPVSPGDAVLYRDVDWLMFSFSTGLMVFWTGGIWLDARRRRAGKREYWFPP